MSEAATKPDIVVGVDGSDESFAALKWALEEASLTGQSVNAVFGWTHSWDMGSEPDSDEAWAKVRHDIANELRVWVDKAAAGIDFDPEPVCLSELKADGFSYLCFVALFLEPLVQTDDGWQKPLFDGDFDGGEEVKKAVGQASYLFAAVCYYGCEKWLEKRNSEALKNHDADGISEVLTPSSDPR